MATQAEINNMSKRDRLWYDLEQSYGNQVDESNKSFANAYSEADRQLLSRGMQRSSYGAQTLANVDKSKIEAQNKILGERNAAYASGLRQIEQEEEAQRQWQLQYELQQQQLEEQRRQFDASMAWQREQAAAKEEAIASNNGGSGTSSGGDNRLWATDSSGRVHYFDSYAEFKNFMNSMNQRPMTP